MSDHHPHGGRPLNELFYEAVTRYLRSHTGMKHTWEQDRGSVVLRVPAENPDGFPVQMNARYDGIMTVIDGDLTFDVSCAGGADVCVEDALGLLESLLTRGSRVRVVYKGNSIRSKSLEMELQGNWSIVRRDDRMLYNWFGRERERLLQNGYDL